MQFSLKLFLDKYVGKILCFLLIPVVYCLGIILKRDHSITQKNVKQIAVAKYFGLGSITQAMPMLRSLKKTYPSANIIFITRSANRSIIPHIEDIDEAFFVDDNSFSRLLKSNLVLLQKLYTRKIDLFFDLEVHSTYGALVSLFSLARNRLGFFSTQGADFKAKLYTHLIYFNTQMAVRLCYLQLARLGGGAENQEEQMIPYAIPLHITESVEQKLKDIFPNLSKIIAINVNASELSFARRWPLNRFSDVASHFAQQEYGILLLGSAKERQYVEGILPLINDDKARKNIYNSSGELSFSEMLATLKIVDLVLTNDTGIMNFAYAQQATTVALYGPDLAPQNWSIL